MNLSEGKTRLDACPHVSEEARAKLAEAEAPPIRRVSIGVGEKALTVGGETVLFRHEKRFENPPGFAMHMTDTMDSEEVDARLKRFRALQYERIGLLLRPELLAVECGSGNEEAYAVLIEKVVQTSDAGLVLMSPDPRVLSAGLQFCADRKPLLYGATPENAEQMAELAVKHSCPLSAKASGLEELAKLTDRLAQAGVRDLLLDCGARTFRLAFEKQIALRRAAIYKNVRALGYPTIVFPCEMTEDPLMEALMASVFVAKYGGIIVLSDFQGQTLFPLLLQRLSIYNDPQQPLMVPEGIYEIGEPDETAPVLLTSNWALTYLHLSSAIEAAGISAFLCTMHIEETDVMCWCHYCLRGSHPGNLDCEATKRFVRECGLEQRVKHRKLIIPERTAQFEGELEKALPEWEIIVGPAEAGHLAGFLQRLAETLRTLPESRPDS
jgi:acetyl-CoA decarbonylase/synthase complex subunit gamma